MPRPGGGFHGGGPGGPMGGPGRGPGGFHGGGPGRGPGGFHGGGPGRFHRGPRPPHRPYRGGCGCFPMMIIILIVIGVILGFIF